MFIRLIAKGKRFTKIDFKYSIFDTCYLRNCIFDSCDFTGCHFIGVNFYGASFTGCVFNYATFEKTIIDSEILNVGCPGWENLKLKFARTLRMNFQQLGDSQDVNKAIKFEFVKEKYYCLNGNEMSKDLQENVKNFLLSGYAYICNVDINDHKYPMLWIRFTPISLEEIKLSNYGEEGYKLKEKLNKEIPVNRI